jgi:UDP-glucose 4-epimerase
MKALVTGAAGFIGRRLIERLRDEGCEVVALVHQAPGPFTSTGDVKVVAGDIRDASLMKSIAKDCDVTFHLAGRVHALSETKDEEPLYHEINVEGTRNLLEGSIENGVKAFVFFSSVKAAGEGGSSCIDETFDSQPETAYGRSKLTAEEMVFDYGKRTGMHVVCLRLPLVYGPGNKGNLYRMIAAIDRGMFAPLPRIGNRRSMVHVANVVEAALAVAQNSSANGQRYIVTDPDAYATNDLYRMICEALGRKTPSWSVPISVLNLAARAGDFFGWARGKRFFFDSDALEKLVGSAWYSSAKIERELGYNPAKEFRQSLPELIDWYRGSSG